ncbi:MAG: hypothetical protein PHU85_09315 [Phycisphaerae bacterium]|nr:hypothetical protein [Phycisphaerae bacterium]
MTTRRAQAVPRENVLSSPSPDFPPDDATSAPWLHAPLHLLSHRGAYFVTIGAYRKLHHFRTADRLAVVQRGLLKVTRKWGWTLDAWAIFSNHYHFVGHSPPGDTDAESLPKVFRELHEKLACWINRLDGAPGRQVWHNYCEKLLTYQRSYVARLKYTHHNAVKHGLVATPIAHPWCSAGWFERTATAAQLRMMRMLKVDRVSEYDEFDASPEW